MNDTDTINYNALLAEVPRDVQERKDIGMICGCGDCHCCATLAGAEAEAAFLAALREFLTDLYENEEMNQ